MNAFNYYKIGYFNSTMFFPLQFYKTDVTSSIRNKEIVQVNVINRKKTSSLKI